MPADLILLGRVWTGDPERPRAEAVAIAGDRILAVGSETEVARYSGPATETLGDRRAAIVPGFIDAHLHFLALARRALEVDCSSEAARSVGEIIAKLRAAAGEKPPGAWIRGFGYDEFFLDEKRPPRVAELDHAAPAHPVRLLHRTGHAAVLNSLAFRLLDLPVEDVVHEPAERVRGTKPENEVELSKLADAASQRLLAAGITTFHDPTPDPEGEGARILRRLVERGTIRQRVRAYGSESGFSGRAEGGGEDRFRRAGVKIVVTEKSDGEEVAERVAVADRSGAQVAIHAVEEGPLVIAIDALSRLGRARVKARRHRIEHATLCPPVLCRELAACGATVVTHPHFLLRFGEKYRAELPPEQWPWLYPLRTFLDCGVPVALGSDAPIAPPSALENIQSATARAPDERSEAVSVDVALGMHTRGGAEATIEEDRLGTLAPGRFADAVVLEADPTAVAPGEIGGIAVLATVAGGRVAWQR